MKTINEVGLVEDEWYFYVSDLDWICVGIQLDPYKVIGKGEGSVTYIFETKNIIGGKNSSIVILK